MKSQVAGKERDRERERETREGGRGPGAQPDMGEKGDAHRHSRLTGPHSVDGCVDNLLQSMQAIVQHRRA